MTKNKSKLKIEKGLKKFQKNIKLEEFKKVIKNR